MRPTTDPMAAASSSTGITTSGTDGEPTVRAARIPAVAVLGPAALLVVAARLVGISPSLADDLSLGGPPLIGHWNLVVPVAALAPGVVGLTVAVALPWAAERLRWPPLLAVAWAASAAFAVSLAVVDGWAALAEPLAGPFEYRAVLGDIDRVGVRDFVSGFVERLPSYPTHVRGHPVGAPLAFWALEHAGLRGAGWAAGLVIAAGTSTVVSAGVAVRVLAGEAVARRAIPFLVAVPALVWVATSADALFAGVVGASIALFVSAAAAAGRRADALAVAAGAVGAIALHLSYGAAVMLLPAAVVLVGHRRIRALLVGSVGAAAVTALFLAFGFWWFDGLAATEVEYRSGAGGVRPFWYFAALGNPAALLFALGPAVPVAVARLRDRRLWLLVGGALVGVVLADLSGLSKAEVERIWLPFVPWIVVATAVFPARAARWWLGAQVATAIALQLALESPW